MRQIENLCRMKTEADVRNAMRTLPENTLNEIYEEAFDQIPKSGEFAQSYATQAFSMLLCAQEALSPEALLQVMAKTALQHGEIVNLDKMIDICLDLVVLDSELNILRFAHISFQEFLETRAEFAPHNIHKVAAATCLAFCLEGLPRGMESELSPKDHFHHYSAVYWAEHCRITVVHEADQLITNKIEEFVFDGDDVALDFIDWMHDVNHLAKKLPNDHLLGKALNSVFHSGGSPLFTACVFGLVSILDHLGHGPDYNWNQTNDFGQSGLYLAAASGQKTIVQRLLQHDIQVNTFGGKFGHPLHAACFRGDASIVEMLLDHAADPKLGSRSALEYALLADNENVALLLLDGRFEISNQAEFDSILQQAAGTGCTDVVRFLQQKYASIYGDFGSSRCKSVEIAIFRGRMGVVERYIQNLSDPKIDMPKGAIATAALGGQNAMISFLVDHRLDLNEEAYLGTPLRAASVMCHESTVRFLLRLGASVHVSGSFGEPLQAAAMRGHESIIRILLSHGADVNSQGGIYGTALQAAAHRGHQKVVEILLEAGADVYRKGFSRDAFHAASEGGHEGIVSLLFEKGFEIRQPFPYKSPLLHRMESPLYRNLLHDASPSQRQMAKADKDRQAGSGEWRKRASMTDFSLVVEKIQGASSSEHELKMPFRAQPEYRSQNDEVYALRVAAANGHVNVIDVLLSRLDMMGIPKSEITVAFKEACGNGHEKAVSRLLSDQVEVKDLKDALEAAALKGHLTVVNLLIHHEDRLGLAQVESVDSPIRVRRSTSLPAVWANRTLGDL